MGNKGAKSDLEQYRNGYPGQTDDISLNDNYRFYFGEIPSRPDGDYIDNIHKLWWGDVPKLEIHHGYIQWLFPIREHGMNYESQPLQKHEIEKIKNNPEAMKRLKKSYEMMLDFYGCRLKNPETGELERHPEKWKKQYNNLQTHSHNFLRITRILKCLGEFDLHSYQHHFLEHFIEESFVPDKDSQKVWLSNCQNSCENFWVGTVKDDKVRERLETRIKKLKEPITVHDDETETENEPDEEKLGEPEKEILRHQMLEESHDTHHDDDDENEENITIQPTEVDGENAGSESEENQEKKEKGENQEKKEKGNQEKKEKGDNQEKKELEDQDKQEKELKKEKESENQDKQEKKDKDNELNNN